MAVISMRFRFSFFEELVLTLHPLSNGKRRGPALLFVILCGFGYGAAQSGAPIPREFPTKDPQVTIEKTSRTPAQQKIDSQLLRAALRKSQGLSSTEIDLIERDSAGRAAVDISGDVTEVLLEAIRHEGGIIVSSYPQFKALRAYLTLESLESIANLKEVRTISRAARMETANAPGAQTQKPPPDSSDLSQGGNKTTSSKTQKRRKHRRHTSPDRWY